MKFKKKRIILKFMILKSLLDIYAIENYFVNDNTRILKLNYFQLR